MFISRLPVYHYQGLLASTCTEQSRGEKRRGEESNFTGLVSHREPVAFTQRLFLSPSSCPNNVMQMAIVASAKWSLFFHTHSHTHKCTHTHTHSLYACVTPVIVAVRLLPVEGRFSRIDDHKLWLPCFRVHPRRPKFKIPSIKDSTEFVKNE